MDVRQLKPLSFCIPLADADCTNHRRAEMRRIGPVSAPGSRGGKATIKKGFVFQRIDQQAGPALGDPFVLP